MHFSSSDICIVSKWCYVQAIKQSHIKVSFIIQMSNRLISHPYQLSVVLTSHVMKMDGT